MIPADVNPRPPILGERSAWFGGETRLRLQQPIAKRQLAPSAYERGYSSYRRGAEEDPRHERVIGNEKRPERADYKSSE